MNLATSKSPGATMVLPSSVQIVTEVSKNWNSTTVPSSPGLTPGVEIGLGVHTGVGVRLLLLVSLKKKTGWMLKIK